MMTSSHSRPISIETFSRAGLNGGSVVNLAEERSSVSSILGTSVHRKEEIVSGTQAFASTHSPYIPGKTAVKRLKAAFCRSLGLGAKALPFEIVIKKHGLIDQNALEDALVDHTAPLSEVTSFKITSSHSYIGYNRLVETLDYLSQTLPSLQEIVLYSQVYILVSPFGSR
ncbi:hypothetical protein FRC01_009967 [Tulasnella sp. 417]|nr:hypothetical protein FRC01_009967 [Tulasnella sp. 417]